VEGVREDRGTLHGRQQRQGILARIAGAQLAELILGPVDQARVQARCLAFEAAAVFAEADRERPEWASVGGGPYVVEASYPLSA